MSYMPKQDIINHKAVGDFYEKYAKAYLEKKGFSILHEKYRSPFGEIDLIAKKDHFIIFIEVKYKKDKVHGYPRESVTRSKQQKIIKTASFYLTTSKQWEQFCRFDVIEVLGSQIVHIPNAFSLN